MKIIHTLPAIAEEASGPFIQAPRLCESLINCDFDVRLAVLDWVPMVSQPAYLRVFPLGFGPKRLGRSPAMKHWLLEEAKHHKVDIIHNHSLWMMPNVATPDGWQENTVFHMSSHLGIHYRHGLPRFGSKSKTFCFNARSATCPS